MDHTLSSEPGENMRQSMPEQVWEAIFNSIPDLVTVIDKNCKIIRVNKAMAERVGMSEERLQGMHCYESIHGMLTPLESCPHMQLLKDGKSHVAEVHEPLLDGVFIVSTTPFFDQDGKVMGSVHIARNITERKQAEDKLQMYNKELEDLNASKDKFFSVIAHDLKGPFQGLLGFTDLLLEDFEMLDKGDIYNYLLNIRNAATNTYSLLENLLEWSRLQAGRIIYKPTRFNLHEEVTTILDMLNSSAIRKEISLQNRIDPSIDVKADQNMIHSVVQNLVYNAIKFSNSRGRVEVYSEFVSPNGKEGVSDIHDNTSFVKVHVRDNGIGIPAEAMHKIFNLTEHFTINGTANEPGTGLGLILSKEMVEMNGGEISVQSKAGEGSTFTFSLPVVAR